MENEGATAGTGSSTGAETRHASEGNERLRGFIDYLHQHDIDDYIGWCDAWCDAAHLVPHRHAVRVVVL